METPLAILITATVLIGLSYVVLPFTHDVCRRFRYGKIVICPDNHQLAEVKLHAGWAALTAIFHKPVLRVKSCSSWPIRKGCAENCVRENWPME